MDTLVIIPKMANGIKKMEKAGFIDWRKEACSYFHLYNAGILTPEEEAKFGDPKVKKPRANKASLSPSVDLVEDADCERRHKYPEWLSLLTHSNPLP